jgi:hypothetical protein
MLGNLIKDFLKKQIVALEKKIQESPNKLDDKVWEFVKDSVHKWIDSL